MEYFVISAKFVPLKYYTLSLQLQRLTSFSVGCSGRRILSPGQIAVMRKWSILHGIALTIPGGGHWPRKGVWGCAALKTPFSRLSCRSQGSHFKQRVSSQDPLFRKFGNFSLNSLNFHPNFSSQAPKFGNFQLTSPQIWKFSTHKPPNLEIFRSQAPLFRGKCQFTSPTLRKSGPHTPTWKKVECPPPGTIPMSSNNIIQIIQLIMILTICTHKTQNI